MGKKKNGMMIGNNLEKNKNLTEKEEKQLMMDLKLKNQLMQNKKKNGMMIGNNLEKNKNLTKEEEKVNYQKESMIEKSKIFVLLMNLRKWHLQFHPMKQKNENFVKV